jgi:hypothetical protein
MGARDLEGAEAEGQEEAADGSVDWYDLKLGAENPFIVENDAVL